MEKNKQKLLCILDIIKETDYEHPITTNNIIRQLKLCGIEAERKSVLRDIAALSEYGYDIILHSDNKLGYYLANRDFEDWELKILCDAVSSARFLTKSETDRLITKIYALSSKSGAKILKSQNIVKWRNKATNSSVKYNIDKVMTAIKEKKAISFNYLFTDIDLEEKPRRNGFVYKVSPYVLYWRTDRYYLIGCTAPHSNLSCYRLDRIKNLEISGVARSQEEILGINSDIKISEYVQSTLNNFNGEKITLELVTEGRLLNDILDFFGNDIKVKSCGEKIIVTVRTTKSEGLYRWLMEFGHSIRATAPNGIVDEMQRRIQSVVQNYATPS